MESSRIFIVGSGVDVSSVKSHLQHLVSLPVSAPEEPALALARGAALASAHAPAMEASTAGLAYSQDPDETTAYVLTDATTTFLGHADAFLDTADIASDYVPERSKPFLLMGSSLTALFVAGMMALTIAMVINVQPTADRGSGERTVQPNAMTPPTALPPAPQRVPKTAPAPALAAPPPAPIETARLMVPPAPPPPRVVVHNAAPAPAAPPPAPAAPPAIPPPIVVPPVLPVPIIQWLPPILQPPPYYNPQQGPQWYPGPKKPPGRHGGGGHGHGDEGD